MKKKVLLVDDVKLFLKLEETFFRRSGCEILTAQNGEQALALARERVPDLILLDYIMPDVMGDEVCRRLKSDPATKEIPIIMVSTAGEGPDIEKCLAAGADDYVTKPINAEELLSKAALLLRIPYRLHSRIPVRLRVSGRTQGRSFAGMSKNISIGGILVECREEIPVGAEVELELPISASMETITLQGVVVRSERPRGEAVNNYGIQFKEMSPEDRKTLEDFLARRSPGSEA